MGSCTDLVDCLLSDYEVLYDSLSAGETRNNQRTENNVASNNLNKNVKVDYSINVDVLKQEPLVTNFNVSEDLENLKLNVSFDIEDMDKAFIKGTYNIVETTLTNPEDIDSDENVQAGEDKESVNQVNYYLEIIKLI